MIWFESNKDFMPFKYQYNSFQSYVFQRHDLIFSTCKADWFDKLSLMSNSFHCWRTGWGCCFFLFLSIALIKTNWIELMVLRPRITVLPSQSCSSLKWDKSSVPCNQTSKKSTRQLPCLLLLLWAHYHISIKFTNNNLAWKSRRRLVWTQENVVALDVTVVVVPIKSLLLSWLEINTPKT